jgi:hypothetical protein
MTHGQSLLAELRAAHAAIQTALDRLAAAEADANDLEHAVAQRGIDFARKALIRTELGSLIERVEQENEWAAERARKSAAVERAEEAHERRMSGVPNSHRNDQERP